MQTREEKMQFLKGVMSGKIKPEDFPRHRAQKGIIVIYTRDGLYYNTTNPGNKMSECEITAYINDLEKKHELTVVYLPEKEGKNIDELNHGEIEYEKLKDETLHEILDVYRNKTQDELSEDALWDIAENRKLL
jgi:hypothetical protein